MNWEQFFHTTVFDGWQSVLRVAASALGLYMAFLVLNRLHGTRTTSKMNNFAWIIAVASGTIFGSAIIAKDTTLAEGFTALLMLTGLQWVLTKTSAYWPAFHKTVSPQPALLFHGGDFIERAMKAERVTRAEVLSAVREAHVASLSDVSAVVLEPDGSLNVLPGRGESSAALLDPVRRYE